MEKSRGSIMAALLLGTGWFFHAPAGHRPASPDAGIQAASNSGAPRAATVGDETDSEGPWKASCQYWEALRPEKASADATGKKSSDCTGAIPDGWGIPDNIQPLLKDGLQAHAAIATVPDPVHSHLAPEFDRALDALIEAASDNGYLASYSWLPWKAKVEEGATAKPIKKGAEEPGLLIFDKRSTSGETATILYVFLVAEMPADGLNAGQLKKALSYELQLDSKLMKGFATDQEGRLRVIGPQYSGSAMSMIQTIDTILDPAQRASLVGTTQTEPARRILNRCLTDEKEVCKPNPKRQYVSFASGKALDGVLALLQKSGYDRARATYLREDGTFFGSAFGGAEAQHSHMLTVSFPRDISLLRNSHTDEQSGGASGGTPTPYLRFTTRDQGAEDTLPEFSKDVTPLSQEAQLMSISHTLTQLHADFAYIVASNPMDALFLAKSLHRSNPDTRLVMEPDLLLQREGDDEAYIGSLSVTPYPLVWAGRSPEKPGQLRTFANAEMEAYYNAASFTLGLMTLPSYEPDHGKQVFPILYGYRGPTPGDRSERDGKTHPGLWLTAVGSDGYYPIAMLSTDGGLPAEPQNITEERITVYPSHVWQAICVLVGLGCLLHIVALCSASYASPQTCDLDIEQNSMRHRRVLYGQVGGAALFLMSAVTAFPAAIFLPSGTGLRLDVLNLVLAGILLLLGIAAWALAIWKTCKGVQWDEPAAASLFRLSEKRLCAVLYYGAIAASLVLAGLWLTLCIRSDAQHLGSFFSYRCLHPLSGVSPIAPALLLLWGWFSWALLHAKRLRLTTRSRPRLPNDANLQSMPCPSYSTARPDLFVSDDRIRSGLLEDTTCLMISRRVLQRIFRAQSPDHANRLDAVLMVLLVLLAAVWIGLCPVRSLDHLGIRAGLTALYELFIGLLLVPLLVIAMCAAARLFLMAASLRAHLLEPLERMPLRQAFTRLKGFHWVGMLRESGQLERWRDMARSTEGIRQILNDPELPAACRLGGLADRQQALEEEIARAQDHVKALRDNVQSGPAKRACEYMEDIEKKYAACAESILCCILLPHWTKQRHDLMQSVLEPPRPTSEPNVVLLAEEFLALRYVAFIRAILAQMRYLLLFITAALVLVMLAVNSYPFQPKQEIDWCVTGLFLFFSAGIVLVFAQMHRNPLLSRITDKAAHELGTDFYLRVAMFGAVPLITWLATQYPSIGSTLYGLVKPGLDVMK